MTKTIPFSNIDSAWYYMEHPTNLMMISGIMLLKGEMDFERFKKTIEYRLLPLDRFRMRAVKSRVPLRNPIWEPDPYFDLDWHVQRIALPFPGDETILREVVSNYMSTGLDFAKPLWQFHLIEGYQEGPVIMGRLHHSIADGIALVAVMLNLMDFVADAPLKPPKDEQPGASWNPLRGLTAPARAAIKSGQKLAQTLAHESMEALTNPTHALDLVGKAATGAATFGHVVLMPPDPPTPFKGPLGVKKLPAWSDVIPLADVKKVSKVMGAKINDVLLACVAGGLRRYLLEKGVNVEGMNFRAVVPVNLRPAERALELGNEFSLVFLPLPVGISDPLERLFTLKKRMDAIKDSPEAMVNFGILNMVGISPGQIADQIVNLFGTKATAVMTNVPGPPMALYLSGCKLDNLMFWVPQSGRLGLGVSIFSYAGKVTLGVVTDAGLIPDPQAIIDGFEDEFEALMALVRQAEAVEAEAAARKSELEASIAELERMEAELVKMELESETERCRGTTQKGTQCKNTAQPGSDYCHIHQR